MQNPIVKNGVIYGIISIIATLVIYLVNIRLLGSWSATLIMLGLGIYFMVKAVQDFKKQNGGFASFGEALIQAFGTAMLATLISMIFTYILYNFIDTGLNDVMMEQTIERFEGMEGILGEEGVEAAIASIEETGIRMDIPTLLQGLIGSGIFNLVISLIIAAITKKKNSGSSVLDQV